MACNVVIEDRSNWMSKLTGPAIHVPLSWLAIPGSHDSGTSALIPSLGIVEKEPLALRVFGDVVCCGSIIRKWSKTQNLTIKEQLYAGIRFLDVRVAQQPETGEFRLVHAQYGDLFLDALTDIRDFLDRNPREVIIFEFNHLYYLNTEEKQIVFGWIEKLLGDKLVPPPNEDSNLRNVTLQALWESEQQIVLLCDDDTSTKLYSNIWSCKFLTSHWANTFNVDTLINFLETEYKGRKQNVKDGFYVLQGVLGSQPWDFCLHPWSGMERQCSEATGRFTKWIKDKKSGPHGLNICMADFVEKNNFIPTVINLNKLI